MRRIVLRRLAALVPLVWLVVTLTFIVVQAAPGSYADTIDNPRLSPETRQAIRTHYGLDRPVFEQYLSWLGAVATGDLGTSFMYKQPVTTVMARALPPTMLLAGAALAITLLFGLILAMAVGRGCKTAHLPSPILHSPNKVMMASAMSLKLGLEGYID